MSAIIGKLREHAAARAADIALSDGAEALEYGALLQRTMELASILSSRDCRVLGLMADNGIGWVVADLAALASGVTVVPIPPFFSASQITYLLEAAAVDTLLVDRGRPDDTLSDEWSECDVGRRFGLRLYRHRGLAGLPDERRGRAAKITFTSGSTGAPKGVCIGAACLDDVAARLSARFGYMHIARHLCAMPLATLLENVAGIYVPLMLGTPVHVPSLGSLGLYGSSRIDARRFVQAIGTAGAESIILQPELLRELTAAADGDERSLRSLRFVAVGGARVAEGDLEAARAAGIPAFQGYGLSECGSVVALNTPGDARPGSVGRPLPGVAIHIAAGGEIVVSGQAMSGYLGDAPLEPAEVATGDLGRLDDDGFLYVTGRRKSVFITSFGRNVSPEWPEAELLHEPQIVQACVLGEARPFNTAVITPAANSSAADVAAAIRRANARLPDYARVSDWIVSAEPFSVANGLLTATGKARREAIELCYLGAAARPVHGRDPLRVATQTRNPRQETRHESV